MPNQAVNLDANWKLPTEQPPDDVEVLAELKPRRKKAKPILAVVEYMRTRKGVHDAEPMWVTTHSDDNVEVLRWRYLVERTPEQPKVEIDPDDPRTHQSDEELGWQYRILLKAHRKGCHVNFATGDIWRSDDPAIPKVLSREETEQLTLNSDRYKKLRGWMTGRHRDCWSQVESLAATAKYKSAAAMDQELDALPECNVGLYAKRATST